MRSFALAVLLLAAPAIASARPDEHGKKVRRGHTRVEAVETPRTAHRRGASDVYFTPSRVQVIREYYGPRSRSLPPGLQKKLYRTGQLPPGWQRKVSPFQVVVGNAAKVEMLRAKRAANNGVGFRRRSSRGGVGKASVLRRSVLHSTDAVGSLMAHTRL